MYTHFYGLSEMPFSLTPDSRFLFLSSMHKEALSHLLYGIRERKGFILVTGEIGAGKTTLCRALINELGGDTEVAFIMNTFLTERELLKSIVCDLMAECKGRTKKDLIDQLNGFLLRSKSAGKNVVILIDECQNLSTKAMEQIRMLSNLETEQEKLIQIMMVGQPEVRDILAMPKMRQLDQRIAVRYHLNPLSMKETGEYIRHRLAVAGMNGGLEFGLGAVYEIYRYSRGIPRLINIICDRALLIGYVKGKRRIGMGVIRKARLELSGQPSPRAGGRFLRIFHLRLRKVALAASVIFAALLVWANWDRLILPGRSIDGEAMQTVAVGEEAAASVGRKIPPDVRAAARLLRLWGYEGPVSMDDSIEGLAERSGLKIVASWAELPFILKIDLPCILEVGDDYYVLEGIDGDAALCWADGEEVVITLDELGRKWSGRAIIASRRAGSYGPILHMSMNGNDVIETQAGLSKLHYYRGDVTGYFDEATEKAVAKLQADLGLNSDGIVGPETRLGLWSLLAGEQVPRLRTSTALNADSPGHEDSKPLTRSAKRISSAQAPRLGR